MGKERYFLGATEASIFRLFLSKEKWRFGEIRKRAGLGSNHLSYYLGKMAAGGLVRKDAKGLYSLSTEGERILPTFTHMARGESGPLPIVLVAAMRGGRILLMRRARRPYKNYWSLVGGKMDFGETFEEASLRLLGQKCGLGGTFVSVGGVLQERVCSAGALKHCFILFLAKVEAGPGDLQGSEYGSLRWFPVSGLGRTKIIPSDLWLMRNRLDSRQSAPLITVDEKSGKAGPLEEP
jgi:8-oxo-dGTP diphosphatase